MLITKEKLEELLACKPGIREFLKYFPEGEVSIGVFTDTVSKNTLRKEQEEYLGWLARYPGLPMEARLWLISRSTHPGIWSGITAREAKGITIQERAFLIHQSNDPAGWFANICAYTEDLTENEKEQLRKMY